MFSLKLFDKVLSRWSTLFTCGIITILFQSCLSYRAVNINTIAANGDRYKIKEGFDTRKVKIIAVKDSSFVIEDSNGQREVQKKAISNAKIGKFSPILTLLAINGAICLTTLLTFLILLVSI